MGLLFNSPLACAPGLSLTFYLAFSILNIDKITFQDAMTIQMIAGCFIVILCI